MATLTVPQTLEFALRYHRAGEFAAAESLYRQVLAIEPRQPDALQYLGVITAQKGDYAEAVWLLREASALHPESATIQSNLGEACRHLGDFEAAAAAFQRAIALQPDLAEAHNNLGVVRRQQGRFAEAVAAYREALARQPANADFCNNLGVALCALGSLDEGIQVYRRALALDPDDARTLTNLGAALGLRGETAESIATYRHAIALDPTYLAARNNLASTLLGARQPDEAAALSGEVLAQNPHSVEAHENLGHAWKDQGHIADAIAHYRRAAELNPSSSATRSNLVYATLFLPDDDPQPAAEEAARWDAVFGQPTGTVPPHDNDRDPARRLRIGYVSADFRDHVIGRNLLPLLAAHDRAAVEIVCYSSVPQPDALTGRFRELADQWRDVFVLDDEQLAAQIRADRVDVLVDCSQHLSGNRLPVFARRPAPVQVSFAGYPASAGLAAIPHRLSDRFLEPDAAASPRERVWALDSFWCYDPCGADLAPGPLPALASGAVTFGCLNNFCKINPRVVELWIRVLQAVPASRLLLLSESEAGREGVIEAFAAAGIDPQRLRFFGHLPRLEYLALYREIDVMLDTFPYNGHNTALDALWMGVPVISLAGRTSVARAGVSLLTNLGRPEWIAASPDEYVDKAAALAADLAQLIEIRPALRPAVQSSVLMDAPRFARQIETCYRAMWREWCVTSA